MTSEGEPGSTPPVNSPLESGNVAVDVAPRERTPSKSRRRGRWLAEWVAIIAIALGLALVLRAFCFQTFYIPSTSMVPTLQVGDRIVVSKLSVRFGTIHRGDILVFTRPPSEACGGAEVNDLVKRVIGLPGEGLKSVGNSIYYTEDPMTTSARGPTWHLMEQPWTHTEPLGAPITPDTVVPQGQYFMMGDNQSLSCDSRYWGPIERDSIVGKVFFRIWPLSRIGFL